MEEKMEFQPVSSEKPPSELTDLPAPPNEQAIKKNITPLNVNSLSSCDVTYHY